MVVPITTRPLCASCKGPLWRPADECRLCWLAFKEDDRNKPIAQAFWGRRKEGAKFSNHFDWPGLTTLGIARVGARAAVGTKVEANSTEHSPATSFWLPVAKAWAPSAIMFPYPQMSDDQRYTQWLQLRAFSPDVDPVDSDIKIQLR